MNLQMIKKLVSNGVTVLLVLVLILLSFVVISSKASGGEPQLFGYQIKTVLSGSMEPSIKTGSIISVKTGGDMKRFKKGDVITFKMDETKLVTHRINKVVKSGDQILYRTKGDNNNAEDMNPVMPQNVVAKYTGLTIPYLGYFLTFVNSKNGAFLLIIPGLFLIFYSISSLWKTVSKLEGKDSKDSPDIEKTL